MSRRRGAIARMKQEVDTLTLRMQFFHLDPKWKNFLEICNNNKLKLDQSHVFEHWRLGCLTTFHDYWVEQWGDTHPLLKEEVEEEQILQFAALEEELNKRLAAAPKTTTLDQIWYMYFATGEYKYMKAAFEIAGHPRAKPGTRDDAIIMYTTIQEKYAEKIAEALDHDPNYFANHDCIDVRNAKYNWERLDAEINANQQDIDEDGVGDDEVDAILAEVANYEFVEGETPDESRLKPGIDLFNKLLIDLKEER